MGGELLAKAAVNSIAKSLLVAARLLTSFAAAQIYVMILMSMVMVLAVDGWELVLAAGAVRVVRG